MSSIRPIAVAVPRRGEDLLVFEYHDSTKDETFHRPLGGGIDFGEIVFVFDCRLADRSLYERDTVGEILDDAGTRVLGRPLSSFGVGDPLYPAGLSELLSHTRTNSS